MRMHVSMAPAESQVQSSALTHAWAIANTARLPVFYYPARAGTRHSTSLLLPRVLLEDHTPRVADSLGGQHAELLLEPATNLSNQLNPNNVHYDKDLAARCAHHTLVSR
jgi:hypothetical protein